MNVSIGIGFFELLILAAVLVFGGLAVSSSRRSALLLVVVGSAGLVLLLVLGTVLFFVRTVSHVPQATVVAPAEAVVIVDTSPPPRATLPAASATESGKTAPAKSASTGATPAPTKPADSTSAAAVDRPEWADQPDELRDGVFHQVVHAGPFATLDECQTELTRLLRVAARDYLATRSTAGDLPADTVDVSTLDDPFLRHAVLRETWAETTQHSFGPMLTLHARLEMGPELLRELADRALAVRRGQRLGITGLVAAGVLGALTGALALLKITARA